jgi:hypothetical protein
MLTWAPRTNCLTAWQIPQWPQPLRFSGWGCEIGNWFGFFAHERLGGLACRIANLDLPPPTATKSRSSWHITLPKACLQIQMTDELTSPTVLERILTVANSSAQVAWLGDSVLRQVIPWEEGLVTLVEQEQFQHHNANFYRDTEEPAVALHWPDGRKLTVSWVGLPTAPAAMTPYLYVRDQPAMPRYSHGHCATPAWVVHARCLVDYPAALALRLWRNPFIFWNRTIIGRYLISGSRLQNLWRAGEWRPGQKRFLGGLWPLPPGMKIKMAVKLEAFS